MPITAPTDEEMPDASKVIIKTSYPKSYFVRHSRIHNLEKESGVLFLFDGTPILAINFDKHRRLKMDLQNIHTNL